MDSPFVKYCIPSKIMLPLILRTSYVFHALLWLLEPDVILDVGSMDGSDSKKFKKLIPTADVIAFEANPSNYQAMCADTSLQQAGIRVVHRLVSNQEGSHSFFMQQPINPTIGFNRGTSSVMQRNEQGMETVEVHLDAVRIGSFLTQEYPNKKRAAMWIDVEGHAYEVLESLYGIHDCVYLIHVEVETEEIWPRQKIEKDILALALRMGLIPIAQGAHDIQRDLILINASWYNANRYKISTMLHIAKWIGPLLSKILMIVRII